MKTVLMNGTDKHWIMQTAYRQWGNDLDPKSVEQMRSACALPISKYAALMPDAHLGYGLPIGGVLATDNAVIPYAVGVDIACRVKLSVLNLDTDHPKEALESALLNETRFGMGSQFDSPREHEVMDRDWNVCDVTKENRDKAWRQLGSSGSGNHFVEFGELLVDSPAGCRALGIARGTYLALFSHSGSRGTGYAVCNEYSKRAMAAHPELPEEQKHLAWLDLDTADGQEYWEAMTLMGHYASANHDCIHREVSKHLRAEIVFSIENHHNFAWKERHFGEDVIVHRKGATPAEAHSLGVIPGTMADPSHIVRGLGNADSLNSAAHGAGRRMSRRQAKRELDWGALNQRLELMDITLLSAGLDEAPDAYKNIEEVMGAQTDLVESLATFNPKVVRMADGGERPED